MLIIWLDLLYCSERLFLPHLPSGLYKSASGDGILFDPRLLGVTMLIDNYELKIEVADHSDQVFEYEAIAHLEVDISEVLPYLNAELKSGTYFSDGPAFSWRKDNHKVGFWSTRIAADHLETREQASQIIEELVAMVNSVWDRRHTMEPDTATHEKRQPIELFKLLPKTNCKLCGDNSCYNFAIKLASGLVELNQCAPICEEEQYADSLSVIESLLANKRPLL